ncbi:MAG: NADH-quinone oxidoreductase subunit E [Chloroflexota bacterium]|nr:MAG: NADH-quinone oxidoreductase subunit E [Chloroflexota bacterium]
MDSKLTTELDHLLSDIRTDSSKLPVLFWLRAYTILASERQTPRLRWAKLSGFVSRTAREFGINGLDHAPGRALLTDYRLMQATPTDDSGEAIYDPDELRALDLGRAYDVELCAEYQVYLDDVTAWVNGAWNKLRSGEGINSSLASVLARWAPEGRTGLLPALLEAQELSGGWLPREVLAQIGQGLNVPLSEVYGVATYYKMLYTKPVGKKIVRVCDDVRCYLSGSRDILHKIKNVLWIREGETTGDGEYTLETVPCMGHCDVGCAIQINEITHEKVNTANVIDLINAPESEPVGIAQGPRLLKNIDAPALHMLDGYLAQGGFLALRKALYTMSPNEITSQVKASGLVGRGGAAFPTGVKWELTAKNIAEAKARQTYNLNSTLPRERSAGYVVCNADESETGTFKDRILLERHPFQVIEGMLLAARAIDATYGYIYIRGEYPLAYKRFRAAVEQARANNYLGANILGTQFAFDIEIRRGAGAYECGEETALFESIEGKRGEPRTKPPFPVQVGLFNRPTVINNVETLANIPFIISEGADEYRRLGTEKSPGTRLVCLSGQIKQGGVFELPMGVTVREVIYDYGMGLKEGRQLQAVLVGGAAGTFLTPDEIDVPLAFETLTAIGATFGSGAVIVMDDTANMWQVLKRIASFFRHESCGKCFPCQIGTLRQLEFIESILGGNTGQLPRREIKASERQLLFDTGIVMRDASLCGLGQFAATAIMSAFEKKLVS